MQSARVLNGLSENPARGGMMNRIVGFKYDIGKKSGTRRKYRMRKTNSIHQGKSESLTECEALSWVGLFCLFPNPKKSPFPINHKGTQEWHEKTAT